MPEVSIIVDEDDQIIGSKPRSEITTSDIYRVSSLWIRNSRGESLMAQRKFNKRNNPGRWAVAVSGTVEQGETYWDNIVREIHEELGVSDIVPIESAKRRIRGEWNFFCQYYTAVVDLPIEAFSIEEDAVEQIRWFTKAELSACRTQADFFVPNFDWALEKFGLAD